MFAVPEFSFRSESYDLSSLYVDNVPAEDERLTFPADYAYFQHEAVRLTSRLAEVLNFREPIKGQRNDGGPVRAVAFSVGSDIGVRVRVEPGEPMGPIQDATEKWFEYVLDEPVPARLAEAAAAARDKHAERQRAIEVYLDANPGSTVYDLLAAEEEAQARRIAQLPPARPVRRESPKDTFIAAAKTPEERERRLAMYARIEGMGEDFHAAKRAVDLGWRPEAAPAGQNQPVAAQQAPVVVPATDLSDEALEARAAAVEREATRLAVLAKMTPEERALFV